MPKPPPKTIKKLFNYFMTTIVSKPGTQMMSYLQVVPIFISTCSENFQNWMSLNRTVFKMEFCNPNRMSYSVPIWTDICNHWHNAAIVWDSYTGICRDGSVSKMPVRQPIGLKFELPAPTWKDQMWWFTPEILDEGGRDRGIPGAW